MKKILLLVALFLAVSGFAFAQSNPFNMVDLNAFDGKWVDEQADAMWEFGMKSVRILFMDDSEAFNFGGVTIKGLWVDPEAKDGVTVKFEWVEGGWKYEITKKYAENFINLKIDKPSGYEYKVRLRPLQQ